MGRGATPANGDGTTEQGEQTPDEWEGLLLADGFGENILAAAIADPHQPAPNNLAAALPLDRPTQRPYWLATVASNRISLTRAWEAIGRPSMMVFGPRHGTRTVVAGSGTTPPPEGWPAQRVNEDRGMARCPIPQQALGYLGVANGDAILIVQQGRALFLANPEHFLDIAAQPGEHW